MVATITRDIHSGDEVMKLHSDGCIERPGDRRMFRQTVRPTRAWRIVGAEEYNNFGCVVRRYTLAEIVDDPSVIPWKWKNGKQRTYVIDFDHGTQRMWACPTHFID